MKNIETHLRKPVVQWLLALLPVLLIIWFAANIHIQTRSIKTTTNEVDIFQHLFTAEDYYVYLSAITQGQSGNLLFKNPYVANPRPYLPHYIIYPNITGTRWSKLNKQSLRIV